MSTAGGEDDLGGERERGPPLPLPLGPPALATGEAGMTGLISSKLVVGVSKEKGSI